MTDVRGALCAGACRYTKLLGVPGMWRCPAHGNVHTCPGPSCYATIDRDHPHVRVCAWTGVRDYTLDQPMRYGDVSAAIIRKSPVIDRSPLFSSSIRHFLRPDVRAAMEAAFWNKLSNLATRTRTRSGIHAFPRNLPEINDRMIACLVAELSQFPISIRSDENTRHEEVAMLLINTCGPGKRVQAWVRLLVPCYGLLIGH